MKKSLVAIMTITMTLVLSLSALTACGGNKHEFSDEWKKDESYHWHECTKKKHTDTTEKIAHVWDGGIITVQPTEEKDGEKTLTCIECGYKSIRSVTRLTHTHKFDNSVWEKDDLNHWHPATCDHHSERDSVAPHSWNGGVVTTPEGYGTAGEKTYTCSVCSKTRVEPIAALDAKDNAVSIASDAALDKIYDGKAVVLDLAKVNRNGDGAISVMYKLMEADDSAYSVVAPKDAGEYTVKAIVEATAEWKGGFATRDFTIEQRTVELTKSVFDRKFGENLESGKFGLTCIDVAGVTNNVVPWVTICAPEEYYAVGIHTIDVRNLFADSDNFAIDAGGTTRVKFTVWDAPDSFYAGIQNLYTFSGSSEVLITTNIANGTVKKGDQILVNEIGKIITVNKIKKGTGTSATEVETATAGEEVGLYIDGATKAELNRGYMLSKPDTIIGYSKFTATVRLLSREEGGKNTPINSGYNPNAYFADALDEKACTLTFPEGAESLMPGGTLKGVTVDFGGAKKPVFVGRRFVLREGGKTVAECVITALPHATRVRSGFMLGVPGTNVIEPIELGEKTFAVNLNRSDLGDKLKNAKDTDNIELKFMNSGKDIAKYTRTPGIGKVAYNEVGGKIVGSYLIVEFYKNVGSGTKLTGDNGEWVFTGEDVYIGIGAYITPASGSGT